MPAFRYRLQPLLDRKSELKEEAEKALVERQKEVAAEKDKLEAARRKQQDLIDLRLTRRREIMSTTGQPLNGDELRRRVEYIHALALEVDSAKEAVYAQQQVVSEAEQKLKAARDHLTDCTREVDILTKYRKKLEERFLRDAEQKEALELDEIGNMLFTSRRR